MASSTFTPMSIRDCWYVRARPSFARLRAGKCVTSRPKSSTVPDDGGMSPEMTLKSVVLPGAVRPEDRPPLAVGDVERHVRYRMQATEAPADPP